MLPYLKLAQFLSLVAISITISSCGQSHASSEAEKRKTLVVEEQKVDTINVEAAKTDSTEMDSLKSSFHYISSVLSGDSIDGNPLNYLFDSLAWKENKNFINLSWKKLQNNRLSKLENWSAKELIDARKNCKTVFYPFSGPDFLTANSFFPEADKLVMLGLEAIGSLPEIDKFSNADAKDYCGDFKNSLNDIFQRSYFITSYMQRDFQKQKVNGLLSVLCFFVKKTGHDIVDIKYLVKHNNDSISEQPYTTKQKPFGVRVICKKDSITKSVYYFKYDVSNKQFNDTCIFYKFINANTQQSVTYIKSASYLLHANFMSNMKKLILKNSNYVLEDDTGIPYNDIEKTQAFTIKLYGTYAKPVKDFPYLKMQTGILKAFETDSANIPKLPFHLGYHWQTKTDLLIYAKKK